MKWKNYNPEWLAQLAKNQHPNISWLPEALQQCTKYSVESKGYFSFVSQINPNQPGSEWQFDSNIMLNDKKEGELILDILKGNRIGGIEFLNKL